jgi:hypothetical protein
MDTKKKIAKDLIKIIEAKTRFSQRAITRMENSARGFNNTARLLGSVSRHGNGGEE